MAGLAGRRSKVEAVVKLRRGRGGGEGKGKKGRTTTGPQTTQRQLQQRQSSGLGAVWDYWIGLDWTGLGQGPGANEGLAHLAFASLEWGQHRDVSSAASRIPGETKQLASEEQASRLLEK